MKITAVSPNPHHLQELGSALAQHDITLIEGGPSRARAVADQTRPDLLLVDGMWADTGDLTQIEYVTAHHPKTAVVLMSPTLTPEFLIVAMRTGVREALPSPASRDVLQATVQRIAGKLAGEHERRPGKLFAFMPCKGGSGASFIAANLGFLLARGTTVLLIDLNLQFGDALSFMHDGRPATTLADVARDIRRLDASFLAAACVKVNDNFSILAAPEDPSQSVEIRPEHVDAIVSLALARYDYVLLDLPCALDAVTIKALDRCHRIYPVMQPALLSLRCASSLLNAFTSLGYPLDKLEFIVNRFEKSTDIGMDDIRRALPGVAIRTVANGFKDVSSAINHGSPVVRDARGGAVTRSLMKLGQSIVPDQDSPGILDRLFRRA